jgi:NAD(P)-dependent dehydrogenase (short-subunit alcohol dehydrogenase family)
MTTVAIATGAGRGMGKACAVALSDMVDALLVVGLDADVAKTPLGRRGVADETAAVTAAFLLSDRASFVNGRASTLRPHRHHAHQAESDKW